MTFSEWLDQYWEDSDICPPPMHAQDALEILKDYLLGEDWYVALSMSTEQSNTLIVETILEKYSRKYRKELEDRGK